MDNKQVTLSFDSDVIENAKKFAEEKGITLNQFIEALLQTVTSGNYKEIEDIPVLDWEKFL